MDPINEAHVGRGWSTSRPPTTTPRSPSSSCSPNGGQRRQRSGRRRDAGEPGVRLRCYLDLRQPLDSSGHRCGDAAAPTSSECCRWRSSEPGSRPCERPFPRPPGSRERWWVLPHGGPAVHARAG
ncbi:DUF6207 family protein [Streptomyces sp. NPDC052693]|uniref:DUF6207 family protein n=1 Tax=Streptomyces sp. NPDC052693 TaxID=3155814 RepID=UPI00343BC72C